MTIYKSSGFVNRDIGLLAPFVRSRLLNALSLCTSRVTLFEGYRTPRRQDELYAQGRTTKGGIVTNAKAWQSWHNYSCAVDIALFYNGQWSWDADYDEIAKEFMGCGFEWLSPYEKAHFQITGGLAVSEAHRITVDFGLPALWDVIQSRLAVGHS